MKVVCSVQRKPLLWCALAVAVAAGVVFAVWPREPVYQGRPLSFWLDGYNRSGLSASNGPVNIEPVSEAVRAMGTNSLPFLLKHILHRESIISETFFHLAAKQRLFKRPEHRDYPYYAPSVLALMVLGPDARPILPGLSQAASASSDTAFFAMLALGTNAIPTLELVCLSTNRETRSQAAMYIATLRAAGPQSVLRWDWSQDRAGGHPLLSIHDKRPRDYGVDLVNLLQSPNPAVRRASADAIAFHPMMRMPVESAMSLLQERLNDPNPEVRVAAVGALTQLNIAGPSSGMPKPSSAQVTGQTNTLSAVVR